MLKKKAIICAALISSLLCAAVLSGCGENSDSKNPSDAAQESSSSAVQEGEASAEAVSQAETSQKEASKIEDDDENGPIPEIVDPTPESSGEMADGGIFVYNNVAYELFYGGETAAKEYADTISFVKKQLGDKITLYNVVVPTHVGVDLPDKFKDMCNPQDTYLNTIVKSYSADVKGVNAFNSIVHHRNEYLYFNSDHHWTALGAYYAPRCEFVELYLNGEYLGVYLLTETIKIGENRVNIPKDDNSYIVEVDGKYKANEQIRRNADVS